MRYERSSQLFKAANAVIPGGVNSPVRAFGSVGGTPIFVSHAKGAYLFDEDGHQYIDYIASWGPMILGHAHPEVVEAVQKAAERGTSFGIPTQLETQIAELAVSMVPHIEKIRFVNSGTEACMSAIRLARGATGRDKIIKFAGCYHGHSDAFLIQAGSGAVTFGSPNSPGVTKGTAQDTLLAQYNNLDQVQQLFEVYSDSIAAIIIEPVAGNMGCILPKDGFLEGLRYLCDQFGALLIFDEVMTGFRLARGGAQELLNVQADIVCFGKVIGGGLPVGAYAASSALMDLMAPIGKIYQAGTLSGNPLAMAAGLKMLQLLNHNQEVFESLKAKTTYLQNGFEEVLKNTEIPYQLNRMGSMISLHFTDQEVIDFDSAAKGNNARFRTYFHSMLKRGVYLPPSAFESYFLNDAISYADLDATIDALNHSVEEIAVVQ